MSDKFSFGRANADPGSGRGSCRATRESTDVDALGARSVRLEALDQLAMEHLLGVR
jgi:hypothetical protein